MSYRFLDHGHAASARGFAAATAACGIRYQNRDDLALIVADRPCAAAALFTTNLVKAAPVRFDQALMQRNPAGLRAVVINSGNANACTGAPGDAAVVATAEAAQAHLGLPAESVFVMSTGVIGLPLPVEKLVAGMDGIAARLDPANGEAAARAIMTTDTRPKFAALEVRLPSGGLITIGGMSKGAGMIHPNMATMLAVVTTDATISPPLLDELLRRVADRSFHSISIDGDTSTNDTLLVLASGVAEAAAIEDLASPDGQAFEQALTALCIRLAQEIVRDGEGATRFVTITVRGAPSEASARAAAMSVAKSPLVKTALFGADPNWGRVLCALGYSGEQFDPSKVKLLFGGLAVLENGLPLPFDEKAAHHLLNVPEVLIEADLGIGDSSATIWTCDFSYDYVRINAEYRT